MPVPLPPPPTGNVTLPPPPNHPPTLQDVTNAIQKTRSLGAATDDDVARASVYKTNVEVARGGGGAAPAWFGPAIAAALREALAPVRRTVAKSYNLQCMDGTSRPFEIVPFTDGSIPTENPHNLPPLVTLEAIQALSGAEAAAYMNGYGLPAIHIVAERKRAIGREIGCTSKV